MIRMRTMMVALVFSGVLALLIVSTIPSLAVPPDPIPAPSSPVAVTNTPLPVTVDSGVTVNGSVTVGNTAANPVPTVGTVIIGETTQLLFDDFLDVTAQDFRNNPEIGPIDVGDYKTVRVVLRRGSCGPCPDFEPRAYIRTVGTATGEPRTIDRVAIDNEDADIGTWASRTYDTAGTSLVVSFEGENSRRSTVRVMVFGRAN